MPYLFAWQSPPDPKPDAAIGERLYVARVSAELADVAVCERKGFVTEEVYYVSATELEKAQNDMMGREIVMEAMTKILFDQVSNAGEAASERGLASEVIR